MKTTKQLKRDISNLIMVLVIVSLFAMAFLVGWLGEIDHPNCKTEKNESYALGYNHGIEVWNGMIIYKVNKDRTIPYYYNQSYYELSINQICEDG